MKKIFFTLMVLSYLINGFSIEIPNPYSGFQNCLNSTNQETCLNQKFKSNFTAREVQKISSYFWESSAKYFTKCPNELLALIPKNKLESYEIWCALLNRSSDSNYIIFYKDKTNHKLIDLRFIPVPLKPNH